jgi:hypothetical protein
MFALIAAVVLLSLLYPEGERHFAPTTTDVRNITSLIFFEGSFKALFEF